MKLFNIGVFSLSIFLTCFVYVQVVQANITQEEAKSLLKTQFIEQSNKNIEAYTQAINAGMTNDQAVENIDKIKNLTPSSTSPVYITGGQWEYVGSGDNKVLLFTPSNAFVPAVPENKINFDYTQRRAKNIEEVIDESSSKNNSENNGIKKYNDAFDELKNDLQDNGLKNSPLGKRILNRFRNIYPGTIVDGEHEYYDGVIDMKVTRRGDDGLNRFAEIKKVAQDNNINQSDIIGYEVGDDNVLRIQTVDGNFYPPLASAGGAGGAGGASTPGGVAGTTGTTGTTGVAGNNGTTSTQDAIVPCGRDGQAACTICDLAEGIHRIVKFITKLIAISGVVVIVVAGIMYIVSAGNTATTQLAKTAMKNALIGVVVVLAAFVIITFIVKAVFQNQSSNLTVEEGGLKGMATGIWTFECK